jgi:hypothetical protein
VKVYMAEANVHMAPLKSTAQTIDGNPAAPKADYRLLTLCKSFSLELLLNYGNVTVVLECPGLLAAQEENKRFCMCAQCWLSTLCHLQCRVM